jgi:hypothetical protein
VDRESVTSSSENAPAGPTVAEEPEAIARFPDSLEFVTSTLRSLNPDPPANAEPVDAW